MINIKTTISFDEYNTIVNTVVSSCFPNDKYSPVYYELMLRYTLIKAFAPDYEIPELDEMNYNEVWEKLTNTEGSGIYNKINNTTVYYDIREAIDKTIDYKIKATVSSSMSDMALSNLFDVISNKIETIDTSIITKDNINTVTQAVSSIKGNKNFESNLVDAMLKRGLLANPIKK